MGSTVDPSLAGWLCLSIPLLLAFVYFIRQCVLSVRGPQPFKQPRWARDDGAGLKQGPLYGEEAAGYVEAKLERLK